MLKLSLFGCLLATGQELVELAGKLNSSSKGLLINEPRQMVGMAWPFWSRVGVWLSCCQTTCKTMLRDYPLDKRTKMCYIRIMEGSNAY